MVLLGRKVRMRGRDGTGGGVEEGVLEDGVPGCWERVFLGVRGVLGEGIPGCKRGVEKGCSWV